MKSWKEVKAIAELKTVLILQSQQGKNLQSKLGLDANGNFLDGEYDENDPAKAAYKKMKDAANEEEGFNEIHIIEHQE